MTHHKPFRINDLRLSEPLFLSDPKRTQSIEPALLMTVSKRTQSIEPAILMIVAKRSQSTGRNEPNQIFGVVQSRSAWPWFQGAGVSSDRSKSYLR